MSVNSILIVDDNPVNIKVLGNLLKNNNFKVEFALNGKSALDWIMKKDFILILLDVMMPEMDGFEVARQLKNNPKKKDIPVIFLTAKTDEESISKGFESGGVDFITKPFNHSELLVKVTTHVALKKAKEKITQQNNMIKDGFAYLKILRQTMIRGNNISDIFPDSFVINNKRNDDGGSFVWTKQTKDKIVFVLADSGITDISASLLSVLCIYVLDEVSAKEKLLESTDFPINFNKRINELFQQNQVTLDHDLNLTICIFDTNTFELLYYPGQTILFLYRDNKVIEYNGGEQKINAGILSQNFSAHNIKLNKNDKIYLTFNNLFEQIQENQNNQTAIKLFSEFLIKSQKADMQAQAIEIGKYLHENSNEINMLLVVGINI